MHYWGAKVLTSPIGETGVKREMEDLRNFRADVHLCFSDLGCILGV